MSELEIVPEVITDPVPDIQSDLGQISALLAGDSPVTEQAGTEDVAPEPEPVVLETDPPEPSDDDAPTEKPQIDYDQEIPMPDGAEPVTISALKDHYQASVDHKLERETWENHRMEQDNQQMSARANLVELANLLGEVKPEALEWVQREARARNAQEAQLLLQVKPEWADADVKKAATPALVDTMKNYGFSETDFAHIQDHRFIKALDDLTRLRAKEKAGAEQRDKIVADLPKGRKPVQRKLSKAQEKRNVIQRAKSGNESDKMAAIGALIDGA